MLNKLRKFSVLFEKLNTFLEKHRYLLLILFLIHIPITYYSYTTYIPFIYKWSWYLKIFVPTCTIVLTLFTLAFLQYFWKRKVHPTLALYCVVAGVSYGIIMTFVLFPAQVDYYGVNFYRVSQIFAHFIMVLEGLIFLKFVKFTKLRSYFIVAFWFILKSVVDVTMKTSSYVYRDYNYFLSEVKYFIYLCLVLFQIILIFLLYFMFSKKSEKHKSREESENNANMLSNS